MIGTEIDIARVNLAILQNTIRQFIIIGLILTIGMRLLVLFINRRYIRKIAGLEENVRLFGKTKDASVAENIRHGIHGTDEVDSLSEGVAQMIQEIQDYISHLVKMHQKLDQANTNVAKMSELALKDGLTNMLNRTAYGREVAKIEERIAKEEDMAFAIVMIDLNNLKWVNDTFGHDRGNESIIKLANMVYEIFQHSMVFRIGGDEFVAILLNEDYTDRKELVKKIQADLEELQKDKSLEPWERINAAIGLATYDRSKDASVEGVLQRADARMYECKKRMKSRR